MESKEALRARFVPPDGGYGWFVAFGAFLVQFWIAGLIKSYGVIYMEITQMYPSASASLASWIPAILSTLCLVLSPLCSALCQRFSCRSVVFTGGLLCWLGISLSFFATSLQQLCLTFGVLTGFGAGLSTTPGIIMTSRYFSKHRALANGLCVSGTAVGSMLIPLLMEILVPKYGFKGSILILGACMLHICLSAALYRPTEVHQAISENNGKTDSSTSQSLIHKIINEVAYDDQHGLEVHRNHILEVDNKLVGLKVSPTHLLPPELERKSSMFHSIEDLTTDSTIFYKEMCHQKTEVTCPPPVERDHEQKTHQSEKPTKRRERSSICTILNYIDFTLIRNPLFLLLASTVMLMAVGCPQALFYLPSYANSLGLTKSECSLLLSISAIFDLIGRLGLGFIADLNLFSKYKAYSISILTSAVAIFCVPFANTFASFAIIVAFYGIGLGSWLLLIPVLLSEHHGTETIGSSYGLVRLFQGIIALIVPPLVGLSKDATGDYVTGFFAMGISMLIGAVLILFKPCISHVKEEDNE